MDTEALGMRHLFIFACSALLVFLGYSPATFAGAAPVKVVQPQFTDPGPPAKIPTPPKMEQPPAAPQAKPVKLPPVKESMYGHQCDNSNVENLANSDNTNVGDTMKGKTA